jgi:hypothetical protein
MASHKGPRFNIHKLDFTGPLNYYFRLHEGLVLQFDEFRYNALDIVVDPDVPSGSANAPTKRIMLLLTCIALVGNMRPVCQMFVVEPNAGIHAHSSIPVASCVSSSVGSNQTSSPITA